MNEIEQRQAKMVKLDEACKSLRTRMDFLMEQYQQLIPGAAASWIRQEFTRGIRDNAEQIEELGQAGIKVIKGDMEYLLNRLPALSADLLQNRATWPHNREDIPVRQSMQKEFFLDRVYRDLISTAGEVLSRHNLLGNGGTHSYWQWVKTGWRYGMNSTAAPVAPEVYEEYTKGLERLRELNGLYETEKKELAAARAQVLWESV